MTAADGGEILVAQVGVGGGGRQDEVERDRRVLVNVHADVVPQGDTGRAHRAGRIGDQRRPKRRIGAGPVDDAVENRSVIA